jgi:hypothetical protein
MNRRRNALTLLLMCPLLGVIGTTCGCQKGTSHFEPDHATLRGPVREDLWELEHDFSFFDAKGKQWKAPKGTLSDGASIPQLFLSIIGDRFDPKYLDAAVVHDAYCGRGNERGASYHAEKWRDVHRMFYEACMKAEAGTVRAKVMYAGVYLFGPRWDDPASKAASLDAVPRAALEAEVRRYAASLEAKDLELDAIDNLMDGAAGRLSRANGAELSWQARTRLQAIGYMLTNP